MKRDHIIFVGIGYCLICIDRLFQLLFQPENDFQLYFLLMFLVIHSINSIKQINDKYIMDKLFVSPFMLLLYQGIVCFFFCLISIILITCFRITLFEYFKNENFSDIIQIANNKIIFFYFGVLLISGTFLNVFLMLTKKYFTPTHRSVADSLNEFFTWVYCYFFPKEGLRSSWTLVNMFDIIGYSLIISGCMLFNELIILHVGDLDHDIKEKIVQRSDSDSMISIASIYDY